MEQSASSEQEIAMLIIGQRMAPSMTSLTNFFIVKWFSLFDICFVPGHYVKSALRGSCHEQLCADNHGGQREVEVGRVRHKAVGHAMVHVVQLADTTMTTDYEAEDEHQRTQQSEKVHGLDAEPGKEPKGKQVQIPVYKTVQPELGLSVFACLMVHHFLADFLEAGVLGQVRDVAVHFAVYLYILDNLFAICLQSAIKVVQVF
mgnify:FL=1